MWEQIVINLYFYGIIHEIYIILTRNFKFDSNKKYKARAFQDLCFCLNRDVFDRSHHKFIWKSIGLLNRIK